jgi:hypothetical protein
MAIYYSACTLHAWQLRLHTFRMCNSYCFSTTTFTWTRPTLLLYLYRPPCFLCGDREISSNASVKLTVIHSETGKRQCPNTGLRNYHLAIRLGKCDYGKLFLKLNNAEDAWSMEFRKVTVTSSYLCEVYDYARACVRAYVCHKHACIFCRKYCLIVKLWHTKTSIILRFYDRCNIVWISNARIYIYKQINKWNSHNF